MVLIANDLVLHNSERIVLDNANINVNEHDKIGIIGVNGTGKSTLLKVLVGKIESESGKIIKEKNTIISYLPQVIEISNKDITILDYVIQNYDNNNEKSVIKDEIEIKSILSKLGISDLTKKMYYLSGGEKRRVMLGVALAKKADLLVLDEPTNHLDSFMVSWLEKYLIKYNKAIIMVTHDRYFLDNVCNCIAHLNHGILSNYIANYSKFLELREASLNFQESENRKRRSFLRKEIEWIHRGAMARTTKDKRRIQKYDNELQTYKDAMSSADDKLKIDFDNTPRLGNIIIELNDVCKKYDKTVVKDFTYLVNNNDRIGIIGSNGVGKTTLLNMIAMKETPDSGTIRVGKTINLGYFVQENEYFDSDLKVIDFVCNNGDKILASKILESFLFTKDMQYLPLSKLSGGEIRRLRLLKVLAENPNVLLLDEPTNDLDIETLNVLEDYIESFKGPVIIVSHDRYFLDKVINQIFIINKDGNISHFLGGYTENEKMMENNSNDNTKVEVKNTKVKTQDNRMSFKEKQEFDTIEEVINSLEEKLKSIKKEVNKLYESNEAYKDFNALDKLLKEQKQLEEDINQKMDRWEYLSSKSMN